MSNRELVVLGTASQVPTRHRNHNGYLLRWDGRGLLFDPGEGTQRQFTRCGVSPSAVTRILVTHFHGDHCLGLPGMIQRLSLDEAPQEVAVHYPASGQVFFERLRHASIFHDRSHVLPAPITEDGVIFEDAQVVLSTHRLAHTVPSWGYRFEEKPRRRFLPDRLEAAGVRGPDVGRLHREGHIDVGGKTIRLEDVSEPVAGQAFALVMDTRPCPGALALARSVDMLVCEATYLETEAREAHERGHMTASQAGRLADEAGVDQLVLAHFSQRYRRPGAFVAEASRHHARVHAAADGEVIPIPRVLPT